MTKKSGSLSNDQFCRFHFIESTEYSGVPLYLRVSEYLVARGDRQRNIYLQQKESIRQVRIKRWGS